MFIRCKDDSKQWNMASDTGTNTCACTKVCPRVCADHHILHTPSRHPCSGASYQLLTLTMWEVLKDLKEYSLTMGLKRQECSPIPETCVLFFNGYSFHVVSTFLFHRERAPFSLFATAFRKCNLAATWQCVHSYTVARYCCHIVDVPVDNVHKEKPRLMAAMVIYYGVKKLLLQN